MKILAERGGCHGVEKMLEFALQRAFGKVYENRLFGVTRYLLVVNDKRPGPA